ncbi:MAG: hypothetical protein ACXVPQ_09755 [Bacteroidia bacterium]
MKKNKKWLLFLVILFPSTFWLLLELSTINSKKLPFFGPKQLIGTDTLFYSLPGTSFYTPGKNGQMDWKQFDTVNYPILALTFIRQTYAKDGFRIGGLLDYTQYKKHDIDKIPMLLVYPLEFSATAHTGTNVKDSLNITLPNIEQCFWKSTSFDSMNVTYFKEKPIYIDYSFFVLLDKKRRVRGYYDGRYVAEIKRLIAEYKHLRIKEEKLNLVRENEIKSKPHE